MKPGNLDLINILIMLLIMPFAYFFPFGLFLFSYAVFGPLHYLTEITWLKKRNFYTHMKTDGIVLIALCLLVTIIQTVIADNERLFVINVLFITAFFAALAFTLIKGKKGRLFALGAIAIASIVAGAHRSVFVLFAILLPTIIHVFVFTALFMFYGALKSRSKLGYVAVAVLFGCIVALLLSGGGGQAPGEYIRNAYRSFESVNFEVMNITNIREPDIRKAIYDSTAGLSVMRFVAFVYTYHYLNWFSKTKVIGWHKNSKFNLAVIVGLWILIVGIYAIDYHTGLLVLYFFSLLHVFLEFPLNHQSILGISRELKARFS